MRHKVCHNLNPKQFSNYYYLSEPYTDTEKDVYMLYKTASKTIMIQIMERSLEKSMITLKSSAQNVILE